MDRGLKAGAVGFLIGGAAGCLLYEIHKWEDKELSFSSDDHLHSVLNEYNTKSDPQFVSLAKRLTLKLKDELLLEFEHELVMKPLDFGSAKTKTAILGSSDFDILIPFKKNAGTLIEIYESVYNFIDERFNANIYQVRKQRHSIGLSYDNGTTSIHIDIVPGRERNDMKKTGDITILRRAKRFWEVHKYIKTNIWKKRKELVNQPETRKIIKLVKIYIEHSGIRLKSPLISSLVKEAFQRNKGFVNSSIYNNWTFALAYIANQLEVRTVVKDPSNSNNNLLAKMTKNEKSTVIDLILSDMEKLEASMEYLRDIFEID